MSKVEKEPVPLDGWVDSRELGQLRIHHNWKNGKTYLIRDDGSGTVTHAAALTERATNMLAAAGMCEEG